MLGLHLHQQSCPIRSVQNEAPFSLVIMLDGWMVRERGPQWAAPPDCQDAERVAWHEVKSGVIYRLDHRAETASGRGVLTQKKVVACPPGTDVLEFGATVQKEALRCGMARAQEVFVVVLIFECSIAQFTQAVKEDGPGQGVLCFAFVQTHLHPPAQLRTLEPFQRK